MTPPVLVVDDDLHDAEAATALQYVNTALAAAAEAVDS
jgi:hypothetical protein